MPKGGRRVGAGRKPRARGVLLAMDGTRRTDVLPPALQPAPSSSTRAPRSLAKPPADLSAPRKAFWRTYAPHAIAEGTLTAATVVGFRELSEQWVLKEDLARVIEAAAAEPVAGDDLALVIARKRDAADALKAYVKLAQRLDATLARFKLTASGKAAPAEKPKAAANPWATTMGSSSR